MKIRVQPGDDLFEKMADNMGSMMSSMMEEMNSRNYFRSSGRASWDPSINLYEVADRYVICVDLAGMQLDQIELSVEREVLHLRGDRPKPQRAELHGEVSVHLMEIDSGPFHRRVPLPGGVTVEAVSAAYQNGYLWIQLPRP